MARTEITVQDIVQAGAVPAYEAANVDGDYFANSGREYIHVKNGSGSTLVVTVQTPRTVAGLAVAEQTISIAAGAEKVAGPFEQATFNQTGANGGRVFVDYDAVTTITIGVFRLAPA